MAGICQTVQTLRNFCFNSHKAKYELIAQHVNEGCEAQPSFSKACFVIGVPLAEQAACRVSTQNVHSGTIVFVMPLWLTTIIN